MALARDDPLRQTPACLDARACCPPGLHPTRQRFLPSTCRASRYPARFIRTARANWNKFAMADSMGRELTYGKALIGALLLSGAVRKRTGDDAMVGLLLPATVGGALANLGVSLAGKTAVNLNFTAG